jgi:hypothetical protein
MGRPNHPNKHIESAVQYAESLGWRVKVATGHAWGRIFCPHRARDGCQYSVWSTPKSPEHHARHLRHKIDSCPHIAYESEDEEKGDEDGNQNKK